jgi:hypothetical protein
MEEGPERPTAGTAMMEGRAGSRGRRGGAEKTVLAGDLAPLGLGWQLTAPGVGWLCGPAAL